MSPSTNTTHTKWRSDEGAGILSNQLVEVNIFGLVQVCLSRELATALSTRRMKCGRRDAVQCSVEMYSV